MLCSRFSRFRTFYVLDLVKMVYVLDLGSYFMLWILSDVLDLVKTRFSQDVLNTRYSQFYVLDMFRCSVL